MPESLAPLSLSSGLPPLCWRDAPADGDREAVRALASSTGSFSEEEVAVAVELVEARLTHGMASGYHFLFAERAGCLEGYACYGPIPLTRSSFDLYWIAVRPDRQHAGLGRLLLRRVEARAAEFGATAMYVETSTRAQYAATRRFYRENGYRQAAELPDFYGPGDGQAIFVKQLVGAADRDG
jgi:GNAT superfamily N-acetyltransferase